MNKRTIWLKGLEIRKMTNKQIANYEFNARITNPDEPSDHELLMQLIKEIKEIKIDLLNLKTNIETRLDNIIKKNNLIE